MQAVRASLVMGMRAALEADELDPVWAAYAIASDSTRPVVVTGQLVLWSQLVLWAS